MVPEFPPNQLEFNVSVMPVMHTVGLFVMALRLLALGTDAWPVFQ